MILAGQRRWKAMGIAFAASFGVAILGSTITDLGPWYHSLRQPDWKPPDAAFGVIWTIIFSLAALSAATAWHAERSVQGRQWLVALFAIDGFFNVLWSLVFFQLRRPDYALIEVAALWLSIVVLIIFLYRRSVLASLLLVPYLIWVTIAAALNYEVVILNGPFT